MAAPKQPTWRVLLRLEKYPASLGTTVYRWAVESLADTEFTEGRITLDGLGIIEFALSTFDGEYAGSSFVFTLDDEDGAIGMLLAQENTQFFINREAELQLLSAAGRAANLDWRSVMIGRLTDFRPDNGYKIRAEVRDLFSSEFSSIRVDRPIARRLIGSEHYGCPKETLGKMYPIILGEHSDEGTIDANGNDAAKGAVPLYFVGYAMLKADGSLAPPGTESFLAYMEPPVGLSASVVGTPGSQVLTYSVSAIVDGYGETRMSAPFTIFNAPNTLNGSNKVRLVWSDPPAWAQYVSRWRIMGRSALGVPTRHIKILSNSPVVHQYDDTGEELEKLPISPAVGTAQGRVLVDGIVASPFGKMLISLGSTRITGLFGSDGGGKGDAEGEARGEAKRIRIPLDHEDVLSPYLEDGSKNPRWPYPEPYVELYGGIRATYIGVKGNLLRDHLDGKVTLAAQVCGYTKDGGSQWETGSIPASIDDGNRADEVPLSYGGRWKNQTAWWGNGLDLVDKGFKSPSLTTGGGSTWFEQYDADWLAYFQVRKAPTIDNGYCSIDMFVNDPSVDGTPDGFSLFLDVIGGVAKLSLDRLDAGVGTKVIPQTTIADAGVGSWFGFLRSGNVINIYHQPPAGGLVLVAGYVSSAHYSPMWLSYTISDNNDIELDNFGARSVTNQDRNIVSQAAEQLKLFINEFILKNEGEGYMAGPFGPLVKFSNTAEVLKTSTFDTWQELTKVWIGGLGYLGNWYINDETLTFRQFIRMFNQTFGTFLGPGDFGQIGLHAINDTADPNTGTPYREDVEILDEDLPPAELLYDQTQTQRKFIYHFIPDSQTWRNPEDSVRNDAARIAMKAPYREPIEVIECRCSNDHDTVYDSQQRQLRNRMWPILIQRWNTHVKPGLEQKAGSIALLTHSRGGGRGPYNAHPFFIINRKPSPVTDQVTLTGVSIARIIGLGDPEPGPSDPVTYVPATFSALASDTALAVDIGAEAR